MGTEVGVLFTQSPVGMALLDLEGRFQRANAALQEMLQLPEEELMGKPLSGFLHPADAPALVEEFRGLAEGRVGAMELDRRFHRRDGQAGWLRFTASLLKSTSGKPRLAFAIIKDVTRWKQSESDLRQAKQQAEELSRTKSQFLAHMSHEIRTPIHTITGMSELLLNTRLDAEQREYTGQVRFASDVLLSLVNDVLDFSKIEAGRLSLEQVDFDLQKVVEETVDLVSLEAHRRGLELAVFVSPRLPLRRRGDPVRLRQVLVNLLSNAVKFTSRGEVELTVEPEGGEELRCTVRDSGIGMSKRELTALFRPFTQADPSTTRKYGGTGLGLTIARSLVELMQGRIGVDSTPGRGTTFWFTCRLPLQDSPGQAPADWREAPVGLPEQAAVLVVEDSAAARRAARGYLEGWGCRVEEAAEAQSALALLRAAAQRERPVRLVLVDQRLPGMDGWQLAGEIKRDPALSDARLVLISPAGMGAIEAKMRLLGWFAAYLTKPLKPRELAAALVRCFGAGLEPVEELQPVGEEEAPRAARVLVAEDHPVNRDMFRILLERCGCEVVSAADGAEALRLAGAGAFALIFLDLQMPNLAGQEAARRLRAQGVRAPIIGMSASVLSQEREQCLAAGMNGFLAKPFLMKDVQEVLRSFLPARPVPAGGAQPSSSDPAAESGAPAADAVTAVSEDPAASGSQAPERVFDPSRALAACLGDRTALTRLASAFLRQLEQQLAAISVALGAAQAADVRSQAHAIKGAALNLWAGELAERAGALEALAASGRLPEAAVEAVALAAASRRFREQVRKTLPETG